MITINMFSGPRNISTTMMRAFENHPDTEVYDEPFYAYYLAQSGADHPMREEILQSQPHEWDAVIEQMAFQRGNVAISFRKHIAFHFAGAPSFDWIDGSRIVHLIRDPRAMIASYSRKYSDVSPIVDSYRVQRHIDEYYHARTGKIAPVVDAEDIQANPRGVLMALCSVLGIPFSDRMLKWPAGPRVSDGVWSTHWYDAVLKSTGFNPVQNSVIALDDKHEEFAAQCVKDYEFFHKRRLNA